MLLVGAWCFLISGYISLYWSIYNFKHQYVNVWTLPSTAASYLIMVWKESGDTFTALQYLGISIIIIYTVYHGIRHNIYNTYFTWNNIYTQIVFQGIAVCLISYLANETVENLSTLSELIIICPALTKLKSIPKEIFGYIFCIIMYRGYLIVYTKINFIWNIVEILVFGFYVAILVAGAISALNKYSNRNRRNFRNAPPRPIDIQRMRRNIGR